jgi:hypothetical protein
VCTTDTRSFAHRFCIPFYTPPSLSGVCPTEASLSMQDRVTLRMYAALSHLACACVCSRFGKWLKVYFGPGMKIATATINKYLLEKSRVTQVTSIIIIIIVIIIIVVVIMISIVVVVVVTTTAYHMS